jgi:hypothetical protein
MKWYTTNFERIGKVNAFVIDKYPSLAMDTVVRYGIQSAGGMRYVLVYGRVGEARSVEVLDPVGPQGFRIVRGPTLVSTTSVLVSQPDKLDPEDMPTVTPSPGSSLNGALFKNNNYIWSGAMNLAWNQLLDNHNNGNPLDIVTGNSVGTTEIANFNKRPFSTLDLSPESYYIKSGYGPAAQTQINQ